MSTLMNLHAPVSYPKIEEEREMDPAPGFRPGLEDVVVAESALSLVDGEGGRLIVRGHPIEALAELRFEAVCGLLWDGRLPDRGRAAALRRGLAAGRAAAFADLARLRGVLDASDAMDALRAGLAALSAPAGAAEATGFRIAGALAVFAAAWHRLRAGLEPVAPDPALAHADDCLRMLHGAPASRAQVRGLDAYLVTVAEHGMNASTFTARVVASTRSDAISAVVAALGSLKGPLHGGAPGPVLDMLDAIGSADAAPAWLRRELAAGRRIMGLGHRVYRVRDPRAAVLEAALAELERAGVRSRYLALARAVERAAVAALDECRPGRRLRANVEFYTAVLLDALGIPRALFTPVFAVGRVAGWLAHVAEEAAVARLIRPSLRYVGPLPLPAAGDSPGAAERISTS
jgi:citrate synthase